MTALRTRDRSTSPEPKKLGLPKAVWLVLGIVGITLFVGPVRAQEAVEPVVHDRAARGGTDNLRPVGLTTAATLIGADALFLTGYGLFMLLEPTSCVQQGPAGECLRTSTPSETTRIHGGVMVGVSAVLYATTVALSVLADEAWRAMAPAEARASLRPWLAADATTGMGGMVLAW